MAQYRNVSVWWSRLRNGYRAHVAEPRRRPVPPLPRPAQLDRFDGMWVAVADGKVVAAADTSHHLALKLHDMDHRKRRRVVIEYVRPTTDSYIVGTG